MSLRALSAGLAAALLLSACGQTGPLYLPDRGGDVITRPAGQTTPPEDSSTRDQPSSEGAPQPSTQPPESSTSKSEKKPDAPR
jgi:predicted small lipoprotein YifL